MEVLDPRVLKQRMVFRRFIQLIILVGIFLMAISSISHENDIFWQIRMGEEIVVNHHFPISDPYNLSNPHAVWTLEEWVPGVIFYVVYDHFGPDGLIFLKAGVITMTFFFLFLLFNRLKVNLYISFLVLLLAALVNTRGVWGVFPSIFEYLFLVLTFFILEYPKKIHLKFTIATLSILALVWANSHGSFFLLSGILASYILGSFMIEKLQIQFPAFIPSGRFLNSNERTKFIIPFIISLITPFVTPNGYWTFIYPFRISFGKFTPYVSEYQKYWQVWNWDFGDIVHGFTFILIVVLIVFFIFSLKKLNPIDVCVAALFTTLTLVAVRHVAIFALVALVVIAKYIKVWFGEYRGIFKRTIYKDVLLILFIICFLYYYKTNLVSFGLGLVEDSYPKEAAEFIMQNNIVPNMFNHYNYGGYLIWKMPMYKVFIDGRLEMYEGQAGQDYLTILNGAWGYKELLEKYKINFFLVYSTDPIIKVLLDDTNWRYIYHDASYAVFVKNTKQNESVIAKYYTLEKKKAFEEGYNNFMADQLNNAGIAQVKKRNLLSALSLFQQALEYNPKFMVTKLNLARGYLDMGWPTEAKDQYNEILKIDPTNSEAKENLKRALEMKRQHEMRKRYEGS